MGCCLGKPAPRTARRRIAGRGPAPRVGQNLAKKPRHGALVALSFALALLAPSAGCRPGGGGGAVRTPGAPVVLISVDTLRSDHLPFHGDGKVETPALSALRADGTLFERTYTAVPLTLPAHVTLMTGLLPDRHGVHDNLGCTVRPDAPLLAELLPKAGYATGGAVSSIVLKRGAGSPEASTPGTTPS